MAIATLAALPLGCEVGRPSAESGGGIGGGSAAAGGSGGVAAIAGSGGTVNPPAAALFFRQGAVSLVADHAALMAHGLVAWPDSIIGFMVHRDNTVFGFGFGTDGDVMRATFAPDGSTIVSAHRVAISPAPPPGQWWGSGGPVYADAASGLLVMVTHDEDYDLAHTTGGPHVSLRMAVSDDEGLSWTDLGKIIDHGYLDGDYHAMGNGGFVIHEDDGIAYFYVYHQDAQGPAVVHQTAVSRAPVAAVIAAAKDLAAPQFHKWNGRDWSSPGVGGVSVDLMADSAPSAFGVMGDIDPYWVPAAGRYVAFYPSQINGAVDPPTWNLYQAWSDDGVHWTPGPKVYPEDLQGGDPIYTGVRAHNRVITDAAPMLYRLRTTDNDDRWGSSTLERVVLELARD